MADEVKLCVDCKHYKWMSSGAPLCKHPEAVIQVDPVHGGKTQLQCDVMRRGERTDSGYVKHRHCGMEAVLFEPSDRPRRQRRAKLLGGG